MPRPLPALTAAVLAVLAGTRAGAQQRPVAGSVLLLQVHDTRGHAVADARVVVGGVRDAGRSDAGGEVLIDEVPAGNRLIELRRPGYAMVRLSADFTGADTVRREITLTDQPIELEGVVATSWGRSMRLRRNGFYDRQRQGLGAFMTSDRIELLHPLRSADIFRSMRGFMVRQTSAGPVVIGTRGGGLQQYCLPIVYLDGAPLVSGNLRDQHDAIDMIPPDDILGVEAYQGVADIPAEYNPTGSACGVILFWTRT